MPKILDDLAAEVEATKGAEDSAIAVLEGIGARIQAAVDAALANGATAEQLAPVQAEVDSLAEKRAALAAAVAANSV